MLNVLALYADRSGCGDYRVVLPAAAVNERSDELGVHVTTSDHLPADATLTSGRYHIRRVDLPEGTDVVSFQRPLKAEMAGAIAWLRQRRPEVGVVVDLDDDLAATPTSNTGFTHVHPKHNPAENFQWLRRAIAEADVLTVSTPALAERYGHKMPDRTFVVRNGVPASMLDQPARTLDRRASHGVEENRDRVVGWAGYAGTHNGDLEVTSGALADVVGADRTDGRRVTFRNVGPRDGLSEALRLRDEDVEVTGWLSTDLYRAAIGELDVGIVPLADTRFNHGKCLDADTWITTRRSMLRAGELREGDEVWHDGKWRKILAVQHDSPRPGYEIVTGRGYTLTLTPEHRLWTGERWITAEEIREGTVLATEPEHRDERKPHRGCGVNVQSAHLLRFLELVGTVRTRVKPRGGNGGMRSGEDDDRVRAAGTDYTKTFCIPDVIWRSPPSVGAAYLSGLFEADGSGKDGIGFCTKSETLARDVQRLLLTYGIQSTLKIGENTQKAGVVRWYWSVSLSADAGDVFCEKIGFMSQRKCAKTTGHRASMASRRGTGSGGHNRVRNRVTWSETVIAKRPTLLMPVDIQVDGEVFAAAGFVSHNSALKMCELAAAGVPVVASKTPEHEWAVKRTGMPAWLVKDRRREWVRALRSILDLDDDELRELALTHRTTVERYHTVEAHAQEWVDAWRTAAQVARRVAS